MRCSIRLAANPLPVDVEGPQPVSALDLSRVLVTDGKQAGGKSFATPQDFAFQGAKDIFLDGSPWMS